MFSQDDLKDAIDSAIETLLWTSVHFDTDHPEGTELDNVVNAEDLAEETIRQLSDMVLAAIESVGELCETNSWEYPDTPEQFGHDFILTANQHGTGFWDRGYGDMGQTISDLVQQCGSIDAYVGDDGEVYIYPLS